MRQKLLSKGEDEEELHYNSPSHTQTYTQTHTQQNWASLFPHLHHQEEVRGCRLFCEAADVCPSLPFITHSCLCVHAHSHIGLRHTPTRMQYSSEDSIIGKAVLLKMELQQFYCKRAAASGVQEQADENHHPLCEIKHYVSCVLT